MMHVIEGVLSEAEVIRFRETLAAADWIDGAATAGVQAALAKSNQQLPDDSDAARILGEFLLAALGRNQAFIAAALPLRVFPPLFNRYDAGMGFADHVDNAIRFSRQGVRFRTDLSCTLFLSGPEEYEGGALVIADTYGEHSVKLDRGDLVLYPSSSLHRVEPVLSGARWVSVFWLQSMIRSDAQRSLTFDLDQAIGRVREAFGDRHEAVLSLTATYHNLLRMWAETA